MLILCHQKLKMHHKEFGGQAPLEPAGGANNAPKPSSWIRIGHLEGEGREGKQREVNKGRDYKQIATATNSSHNL